MRSVFKMEEDVVGQKGWCSQACTISWPGVAVDSGSRAAAGARE